MKTRKFSSVIINYFHKLAELTGSGTVKLESYQAIDDGSVCEPTIVVHGPNGSFRVDDEPRLIAWLDNAPEQLCGFIHAIFPRCGPCSFDAITEPQFPAALAGDFSSQIIRTAGSSDLTIIIQLDKLLAGSKPSKPRVAHQTQLA
jgi:hypothetical protein